jgi:hypothetical protein
MAEKYSPGTRQTNDKNLVWFGDKKRKLPNYQCLPLLTVLPLNYFMAATHYLMTEAQLIHSDCDSHTLPGQYDGSRSQHHAN